MQFGWINLFGVLIVVLIMIPNIIYAVKQKAPSEVKISTGLSICEQVGRYGCIVLMCLPLLVWKFGFQSVAEILVYFICNAGLLLAYYLFWITYGRKRTLQKAMALAIIPTAIFLLSGLLLRHWLLVLFALLFGIAHIRITYLTHKGL